MKKVLFFLIIMMIFIVQCTRISSRYEKLYEIIETYLSKYPEAGYQDVYKLLFQINMGPGHLIKDQKSALVYLRQELAEIETTGGYEKMIEWIDPEKIYVKINLRPFKRRGLDAEKLARVLFQSVNYPVNKTRLQKDWDWFVKSSFTEKIDTTGMKRFNNKIRKENFPVIHHSAKFLEKYHPAYRIVALRELKKQFPELTLNK